MPPNVDAVIAKVNAMSADAEAAPDAPSAPPAGVSEAASASVDVEAPGNGPPASPEAPTTEPPLNHAELEAKLAADREARERKMAKKRRLEEQKRIDADKKAVADELAKWKALGKDKKWLDAIKEAGHDPAVVYEEMRKEALKAGTPEERIEQLEKKYNDRIEQLEKKLEERDKQLAEREKQTKASAEQQQWASDFRQAIGDPGHASLLEEYEPEQLHQIAADMRDDPARIFRAAKNLNVRLTFADGTFTMKDIFNVMAATQAAHRTKMQRRTQSAAPHTSQAAPTQAPTANPTVNGTAARKAEPPTTIGNDLAAERASETEKLRKMTRAEKVEYLSRRYPDPA